MIVEIPRPQIGWSGAATYTGRRASLTDGSRARWCPSCAGRGQVLLLSYAEGSGTVATWCACPSCLGVDLGPR